MLLVLGSEVIVNETNVLINNGQDIIGSELITIFHPIS